MRAVLLYTTCLLFASLVSACAPAPTAAPTAIAPATSTPQTVLITATPWLVTATPAPTDTPPPTAEATTTPAIPIGEFKSSNWTSYSSVDQAAIQSKIGITTTWYADIQLVQSGNVFNLAVNPLDLNINYSEYVPQGAPSPTDLQGFDPSLARSIVTSYLQNHINADHHLDAQFASLWATFAAKHPNDQQRLSDNLYFVLGKGSDSKVWVIQIADRYDDKNPVTFEVFSNGTISVALTPTPEIIRPLPVLHTEGQYLVTENGVQVELKGVNVNTFNNGAFTFNEAQSYIGIAKQWGCNVIRLQLDISPKKLSLGELDKTIDYAQRLGMYVILTPEGNNGASFDYPTQASHDAMVNLTKRYEDKTNILYGLLNEVSDVSGDQWYQDLKATARDIRATNPRAILVMPGWYWNRDFSILQRDPFPGITTFDRGDMKSSVKVLNSRRNSKQK